MVVEVAVVAAGVEGAAAKGTKSVEDKIIF